ncbi:hypothetical protein GCM10010387_18580 [Streptomyces inusitatus]|uniref:Uncharacterized protein n=1 Tax=Streptomyces inusitatus TaxID=68221 RepID=A0A918UPX6_9ACTN|nr:hypothetical protein [Streptomyces inusitatus]GGZ25344.1 hypothetical protein GCM10010387_18580 [Streptomyces inusitatus]
MRLRSLLKTSAALWTAPLWLGIVLLYYIWGLHIATGAFSSQRAELHWAPSVVLEATEHFYAFAFALASALGAWEAGRLRRDGVWELAPARSRLRIAAEALLPSSVAASLMLVIPAVGGLIEFRLAPDPRALLPVAVGVGVVLAFSAVGFAVGLRVPRTIAAPALAAGCWYMVAFTVTYTEPAWPGNVLARRWSVEFGSYLTYEAVLMPLVFCGAVAAAVAVWWVRPRTAGRRVVLRTGVTALAAVLVSTAAGAADRWSLEPPSTAGHATEVCLGKTPSVCMAEFGGSAQHLPSVREEIVKTLRDIERSGVKVSVPARIRDTEGRPGSRSTAQEWQLPLTRQISRDKGGAQYVRHSVAMAVARFPCRLPVSFGSAKEPAYIVHADAAKLWMARTANVEKPFMAWRKSQYVELENPREILDAVVARADKAERLSARDQVSWYERELSQACLLVTGEESAS